MGRPVTPEAKERARARSRAFYAANPEYFRSYHGDRGRRARYNAARRTDEYRARYKLWPAYGLRARRTRPVAQAPQLDVDAMTEQAMFLAGLKTPPDPTFDAGWRDLVQEAVLAMLEGRDPAEAVKAERSRIRIAQTFVRSDVVIERIAA